MASALNNSYRVIHHKLIESILALSAKPKEARTKRNVWRHALKRGCSAVSESEGTHWGSTDNELARASRARGAAEESEACEETVVAGAVPEDTRWRRSKRRRRPSTACRSSSGANEGLTNDTCTLQSQSSPQLTTSSCARLLLARVSFVNPGVLN